MSALVFELVFALVFALGTLERWITMAAQARRLPARHRQEVRSARPAERRRQVL